MKFLSASAIAVVLLAGASGARADDVVVPLHTGPYFTLEGGFNIITDGNALDLGRTPPNLKFHFNDGMTFSGSSGYKLGRNFRGELEFTYRANGVRSYDPGANPLTGHQEDLSFMGNLLYDINTGTRFTPYVGAGLGAAMVWWRSFANAGSTAITHSPGGTKLALQVIAGAAYAIAPQWELVADARFKGANGYSFQGIQASDSITGFNLRDTTIMVGVRYAFDPQ